MTVEVAQVRHTHKEYKKPWRPLVSGFFCDGVILTLYQ